MSSYIDSLFSLNKKTAIITGASRGIGFSLSEGLKQSGANVFGIGSSEKPDQDDYKFEYVCQDLVDTKGFKNVCKEIEGQTGTIDILINSAGITLPNDGEDSIKRFKQTLDINLLATYGCCTEVSEYMKEYGRGSIINITSIGAKLGFPNNPAYLASKAAVSQMTKGLAIDLYKHNIRVNNLVPGYIRTSMTEDSFNNANENKRRLERMIIPRWGEPEDLIGAAIFLSSEASSYITGSDLVVDGGWTAKGL